MVAERIAYSVVEESHSLGGSENAAAFVASDAVMRLLLFQLACEAEQQHLRHNSSGNSTQTGSSSDSSEAFVQPFHRQLFAALDLQVNDAARCREQQASRPVKDYTCAVCAAATAVCESARLKQEQRCTVQLMRRPGVAERSSRTSSIAARVGQQQQLQPVIPVPLQLPLLLTLLECCMLDPALIVISACSQMMWWLLCSDAWLHGGPEAKAAAALAAEEATVAKRPEVAAFAAANTAAGAAAAAFTAAKCNNSQEQQPWHAASHGVILRLMLCEVSPAVLAAVKHGKVPAGLRATVAGRECEGLSRNLAMQGFAGALISLVASSGGPTSVGR